MKKRYKLVDKAGFVMASYEPEIVSNEPVIEPVFIEERKLLADLLTDVSFTVTIAKRYKQVGITSKQISKIPVAEFHEKTKDFQFYLIMMEEFDKFFIEA
ncbi:hypothetical protein ZPAH1_orf00309 [Aeromonas phage ZPAH1]|nr:hypothetical protein ASwh1_261 [Aeromonas phage Aswh_1]QQG34071.1 hypothetical protein ZPAH1_orf00309 [Aeromonas phage ZPAH1]